MTRALALALLLLADPPAPPAVRLAPQATTPGERILLVDVVEASDLRHVPPALLGTDLGAAPSPGFSRALARAEVLSALPPASLDLRGAPEVVVLPETRTVPAEETLEAAQAWLRANLLPDADAQVEVVRGPIEIVVPRGRRSFEIQPRPTGARSLRGPVSVDVAVVVDGATASLVPVSFVVRTFAEGLVLLRSLRRGEQLSAADVHPRRLETTHLAADPARDVSRVLGLEARRPLQAGEAVQPSDFEAPLLVRRGDPVTLLVVRGALRASAHGVARGDARRGETVAVQNAATRRIVTGRVEAEGTVRVEP